jgi:hypothetical protein
VVVTQEVIMPGPVPKRSDQRRRVNKPEIGVDTAPGATSVTWPIADALWHPIARDWYHSLRASGQSAFYEPSDVAVARLVAQGMSELLSADRMSAQLFQSVLSGTTQLMSTEADRRRLRIELARDDIGPSDAELAATADMEAYRQRLGS